MTFILENKDYKVQTSHDFVYSCKVFTNMFEDLEDNEHNEDNIIPIVNSFKEDEFKMYINFFEDLNKLKVKNNLDEELSYLDYIIDFRDEYIENYTNKNADPPHLEYISNMFSKLSEENICKIIEIDKYYDNNKIIRGIMLCIAILIRKLDKPKRENETTEEFEKRETYSSKYIEAIMDAIS